jgi:hypothetical protein
MQTGYISVKTVANEVATFDIEFEEPFAEPPDIVIVSPVTAVPYTAVRYASASTYTATGFKLHIYRTTSTGTGVAWVAIGKAASKKES